MVTELFKASDEVFGFLEGGDSSNDSLVGLDKYIEGAMGGGLLRCQTFDARLNSIKTRCDGCASCRQIGNGLTQGKNLWVVSLGRGWRW